MYQSNAGLTGLIFAPILMTVSSVVTALQANGSVGLDGSYTDNATLIPANEKDEFITTASASATLSQSKGRLTGNALASLRWLDYRDNTFGNTTYFNLGSAAQWEQLSNRLVWNVSDYFSQTSVDNLASNTPDNTQDTNAFSLSATATIPLADRHKLAITPSFSDFYYDSSNNDNQQMGLTASWAYQLDPKISVSVSGGVSDVDYVDDASGADTESVNLNVAMTVTHARSAYSARIGVVKVENEQGTESDGVTGGVSWQHNLTGRSSINVRASSDITDTSNLFLASSIDPITGSIGNVQVSNEVIRNSILRATYNRAGSTVNASIWTELRDLDYESNSLDREVQELGANVSYGFTPLVTGSVSGIFTRTEDTINEFEVASLDGRLNYSLSRKLSANIGLRVQSKDSTNTAAEYDELRVSAGINYRVGR